MDTAKYTKVRETLDLLSHQKANVDVLAALLTVLTEATDPQGNIRIIIERNKQELTIPASLLTDYITGKKTSFETELEQTLANIDLKNGK